MLSKLCTAILLGKLSAFSPQCTVMSAAILVYSSLVPGLLWLGITAIIGIHIRIHNIHSLVPTCFNQLIKVPRYNVNVYTTMTNTVPYFLPVVLGAIFLTVVEPHDPCFACHPSPQSGYKKTITPHDLYIGGLKDNIKLGVTVSVCYTLVLEVLKEGLGQ